MIGLFIEVVSAEWACLLRVQPLRDALVVKDVLASTLNDLLILHVFGQTNRAVLLGGADIVADDPKIQSHLFKTTLVFGLLYIIASISPQQIAETDEAKNCRNDEPFPI